MVETLSKGGLRSPGAHSRYVINPIMAHNGDNLFPIRMTGFADVSFSCLFNKLPNHEFDWKELKASLKEEIKKKMDTVEDFEVEVFGLEPRYTVQFSTKIRI